MDGAVSSILAVLTGSPAISFAPWVSSLGRLAVVVWAALAAAAPALAPALAAAAETLNPKANE